MQVAERLGSMFVQENLQEREVLADSTTQFLESQLEDARRRMAEHEQKLADFRQKNFGQLPGQQQSNLQMLQVTQNQIQSNTDAMNRDRDRLAELFRTQLVARQDLDHAESTLQTARAALDMAQERLAQAHEFRALIREARPYELLER